LIISGILRHYTLSDRLEKVPPRGEDRFVKAPGKDAEPIPAAIADYFPKLSKDFVNVVKRAEDIAKDQIRESRLLTFGIPILMAALAQFFPCGRPLSTSRGIKN
jgi:hypothetical protein